MDLIIIIKSAIIGVVEGITEFLPVSSTGHIIFASEIMGFVPPGEVFEIFIQFAAILALCWLYRTKLWGVASGFITRKSDWYFIRNITLAFIPILIAGPLLYGFVKSVLFSPQVVAISLIVGGIIILIIENMKLRLEPTSIENISVRTAVCIGLFQLISMIPGVSRSGATIMGALLLGMDRKTAVEFSFMLAIPTLLGATVYDLYKNIDYIAASNIPVIAAGSIASFITALLVVRWLINYISTHNFKPFGWYRIIVGGLMLLLLST